MKITCIVTVYNRMEYLKNIVKCLMEQTEQIDELIITDDGSKEKVINYIGDFISECSFKIKHIYQEDLGFRKARALNNAVRETEGELLIFIDQDVIFGKDYIKNIKIGMKRRSIAPLKVLWSTFEEKEKIQKILDSDRNYKEILKIISLDQIKDREKQNRKDLIRSYKYRFKLRKKPLTLGGASYAIFKEDYIKVNGYDEEFKGHGNEDLDFGYRLQNAGINPIILKIKEAPIHMAHSKDPTAGSNEEKLHKNREVKTYCKFGYDNRLDKDNYSVNILRTEKK